MTTKEAVKNIGAILKAAFGSQEFEGAKLSDGTAIEYSVLEAGGEIFVIDADGNKQPAPAGDHELEDGRIVVIAEPGKIAEVKEAAPPAPEEEQMEDEKPDYAAQITALQQENASLKTRIDQLEAGNQAFKKDASSLFSAINVALEALSNEDTAAPASSPKQTLFGEQKDKKAVGLQKFSEGLEAYKKKLAAEKK